MIAITYDVWTRELVATAPRIKEVGAVIVLWSIALLHDTDQAGRCSMPPAKAEPWRWQAVSMTEGTIAVARGSSRGKRKRSADREIAKDCLLDRRSDDRPSSRFRQRTIGRSVE